MRKLIIVLLILALPSLSWAGSQQIRQVVGMAKVQGGATVAFDNFTDADNTLLTAHTSDSGHSWTHSGTNPITITSNRCWSSTNTDLGWSVSSYTPTSADYAVTATIFVTAANRQSLAIAGRVDTTSNSGYFVEYDAAGTWTLFSAVSGTITNIGTYAGDAPTSPKTVKLVMQGTTISVLVDGVSRINVTNSAISSIGKPGVAGYYSSYGVDNYLDNWSVE